MIEFRGVSKSFGDKVILDGVDLTAGSGEILFVIGTSGAGKSVLIQHVVGLLRPDAGRVLVDGEDVTDYDEHRFYEVRKKCALVFQHATLFDSMTCAENVALPLRKHFRLKGDEALRRAEEFLALVQMERFGATYPSALGDGLRKRVAVARALTLSPRYILFDEPTTSLDPVSARRVDALIVDLARRQGATCVVVSHDLRSIFSIADRVAMLYKGRVRALGTPQAIRDTTDPIVRQFIEGRNEGPLETT
ncbi:MAG TPA: ATP-binding cassette domain-containing protein [Polyangiaceae bacterium]|nr:ATP-binding cassette domain-containing protein [Polyangiaceae bacterium]